MPTLSHSGVDLHYDRRITENQSSHTSPIMLLAGIASDTASWNPVLDTFAERAEIITLDNRGAGQTHPLLVETSRDLMVQDVLRVLDACEIEKVTLIGHSMGALISWAVASVAPERVNAIVAASAPFAIDPARVDLFKTLAKLRTQTNEADWFRLLFHLLFSSRYFDVPALVDMALNQSLNYEHRQPTDAFVKQVDALPSYSKAPHLPDTLGFPCLALTGESDKLFSPADLKAAYADHPEIELEVIPNAAHSVHWENPEGFISSVIKFLNRID